MDSQLKKGLLEIGVLASLRRQESYGYKIIADLSPIMEISESTLYPILKRLEASGLLDTRSAEHNGRLRKYYTITMQGKVKLIEFLDDLHEMKKVADYIIGTL